MVRTHLPDQVKQYVILKVSSMEKSTDTKEITPTQSVDLGSLTELSELEKKLEERLEPGLLQIVKKIGLHLSKTGLDLKESCLLARVDYEKFKKILAKDQELETLITIKALEYKKDLLMTLSQKARSGDDKRAEWLLERMFPDEFYISKRKPAEGKEDDMLLQAITFIRGEGDSNPLVSTKKTVARVSRISGRQGGTPIERLEDHLK